MKYKLIEELKVLLEKYNKDVSSAIERLTDSEEQPEFIEDEIVEYGDNHKHAGKFQAFISSALYPYRIEGSYWNKCRKLEVLPIHFTPIIDGVRPNFPDGTLIVVKTIFSCGTVSYNAENISNLVWPDRTKVGYQIIKDLES